VSGLKLFRMTKSGATEVMPRLAEVEADVQGLVEAHMEALLGVRFLASEYGTGPVHGGRIDSLGLDENGSPVIVEYKRGVDAGVFSELGPLFAALLGPSVGSQVRRQFIC
jgi:RecB family endonuclease NucS